MSELKDIQIVSTVATDGTVLYSMSKATPCITGRDLLVQKIIKLLLTSKSSSIVSDKYGSNFNTFFKPRSESEVDIFRQMIPIILNDVLSQIKLDQMKSISTGALIRGTELLTDLQIKKLEFDTSNLTWDLQITVITNSGNTTLRL